MSYTINLPITGGVHPAAIVHAGQATAADFLASIDAVVAAGKGRINEVLVARQGDVIISGVTFKGQDIDSELSFVTHGTYVSYGIHTRRDLYRLNEGFTLATATVEKRKRNGGTYREFVPGSRTFASSWGWDLRPVHDALRAIDLSGAKLATVFDRNFGDNVEAIFTEGTFAVNPL